ncbi:MAG: LLM class flavin-dependent oxidoreductase [Deltaproteobacteria bacterium]|nr:LLM class flavin-dependent oxidoreductase [Deltaproteobacteria bacterium]
MTIVTDKPDVYIVTPRIPLQKPSVPNDITELASLAENLGYERIWIIETNDRDAFSVASQMVLSTRTIAIGTNIVSVFTRTPTLLAMGAFTLDELSGGRFILGIGPGGTEIVGDGHGIPFQKPLTRVRESLDIIRPLLTGGRLSYQGTFFNIQKGFRLRVGARNPRLPIYIAALNPRMLQLAGEKADGVILSHAPVDAVDDIRKNVAEGARRAGRDPREVHICINLPVGVNQAEGIVNLRKTVAWHLTAPAYDWLISHTKYGDVVPKLRELWWSGRREEAWPLMTDDIVLTFGLGYTEDQLRSRIKQYLAQGVTPIIDSHGIRKGHEREDTISIMRAAMRK